MRRFSFILLWQNQIFHVVGIKGESFLASIGKGYPFRIFALLRCGASVNCRSSKVDENLPCYGLKVTAPALEEAVLATIRQQLAVALNDMQHHSSSANVTIAQKGEYEAQMEAIIDEKQMLFESYLSGEIEAETFRIKKAACDDTLQRIKSAYAAVVAQAKQKQEEQARRDNRQKAARAVVSSEGLTADLADLLIDRVLVYQDNRIEIAYKIKDIFD